jgi:hypothetical protein
VGTIHGQQSGIQLRAAIGIRSVISSSIVELNALQSKRTAVLFRLARKQTVLTYPFHTCDVVRNQKFQHVFELIITTQKHELRSNVSYEFIINI